MHHIRDIGEQDEKIEECRAKLEQLKHELLLFEMQLVDQLEVRLEAYVTLPLICTLYF